MSWINTEILSSVQISNLSEEITDIGEYVGYYYNLVPVNGITISGTQDSGYNVSAPNGNNTMYAYSNIQKNDNWKISFTIGNPCLMYVGISTDVNQSFPNPSSPSMSMCDFGVFLEWTPGNAMYLINNGVQGQQIGAIEEGAIIDIEYNGITVNISVSGASKYNSNITFGPVNLVCGSWYGGAINGISFTGSGGSGGSQTLAETLTFGNIAETFIDMSNNDINNVGNLTVNKYLNISNNVGVGGLAQLHFYYNGSSSENNYQIVANGSDDSLEFQYYPSSGTYSKPLEIRTDIIAINKPLSVSDSIYSITGNITANQSLQCITADDNTFNITGDKTNPLLNIDFGNGQSVLPLIQIDPVANKYTFGNQVGQTSLPNLMITGNLNTVPFESYVLDSRINTPQIYFINTVQNQTTKIMDTGSSTSIMLIDLSEKGYDKLYQNINTYISSLTFNSVILDPNGFSVIATFFLSDTKDANYNNATPLATSLTVALGGNGSSFPVSKSGVILSNVFSGNVSQLYLNVNLTTIGNPTQVQFEDFNFTGYTNCSIMPYIGLFPTTMII